MKERIVNELKRRVISEGNGFEILMKTTGNRYCIYFQECGKFHITDKTSIWVAETYTKIFATLDELAEEIMRIA